MSNKGLTKILMLIAGLLSLTACSLRDDEATLPAETAINQQPIAVITPSSEQFVFANDIINFRGDASSDPDDNNPLTYQWTISGTDVLPAQLTEKNPGDVTYATPGEFTATLVVTDSLGLNSLSASVTVHVDPEGSNRAPTGSISHDNASGLPGNTGDLTITPNSTIAFSGTAFDPDGDQVSFAWDFSGQSATATTGNGPINVTYPDIGTFEVTLTVSDDQDNTDQTPAKLVVNVVAGPPIFQHLPVLVADKINTNNATYNLTVQENVPVKVVTPNGSWTTPMMRYNGLQLPPVIIAKRGTKMSLSVDNQLENANEETTVHWHGFKIPGDQDGGPDFPILVGDTRDYSFTLRQPAASLWFHPHADGTTATQVYKGLAGAFVITDDISTNLESGKEIPSGDHDIAMMIQDRSFNSPDANNVRTLDYQPGGMGGGMATGMLGDHILVNGVEMPLLKVDTRQYRFRLYNGSNARTYDFALADNSNFMVVGTDGGLLNIPVSTKHIMLAAGERAEIVVNFANYNVGDNITLVSRAFTASGMMVSTLPNGSAFDVMQFEVATQATDDVALYSSLPATAEINTRLVETDITRPVRGFEMMLLNQGGGMGGGMDGMQFVINGVLFDMNRVDETVFDNAVEIWDISNTTNMAHPFHAHAIQWQILDRNGTPATGVDRGWKDTVLVQPGEHVRFIGRFDPLVNSGLYMYHCHILEHEDTGMMGTFEVVAP